MQYNSGSQSGFHSLDDLRRYSRIPSDGLQAYLLSQLGQVRERAARAAGLDHAGASRSSRGDGEQSVWPVGTQPYTMLFTYPLALHEELRQLNSQRGDALVQLRVAIVDGYSEAVAGGRAGQPPVLLARLVDSKACRMGLTAQPKAYVSLIVDNATYQQVVARGRAGDHSRFVEVLVDDPDKEFQERAWVTVPGATPSDLEQLTAELEAAGLTPAPAAPRAPHHAPDPVPEERTLAPTPLNRRTVRNGPLGEALRSRAPQRQARDGIDPDLEESPGDPESEVVDQDPHPRPDPGPVPGPWARFFLPVAVAVIAGICAILAATVPSLLDNGDSKDDKADPTQSADSGSATPTTTGTGGPTGTASPSTDPAPPDGGTIPETAANRNGTPVFANAQGSTAAKERIPYATTVPVSCWTENASGMTSVNAFYLIGDGPWKGLLAPANTFANGDPLGQQGGSHDIDPKVPKCEA